MVRQLLWRHTDSRESGIEGGQFVGVKLALGAQPDMDIDTYIVGKSAIVQRILAAGGLSAADRLAIRRINEPDAGHDE
jgi:hypothetical protein